MLLSGGALYAQMRDALSPDRRLADTGAAHPVVEGNRIVDARSGREFVPRGVNWSSFEYACAQGWGMSRWTPSSPATRTTPEAKAIAEWGANTVRLPLNQDCWLGTRGAPVSDQYDERTVEGYRRRSHDFVTALNRAGHRGGPRPAQPQADRAAGVRQPRDARLGVHRVLDLGRHARTSTTRR